MHTKEPWKLDDGKVWRIIGADGSPVFTHTRAPRDNLKVCQSEANRDRIVECVNALAGIADPAALRAALEELRKAYNRGQFITEDELWVELFWPVICKLNALLPPETAS